MCREPLADRYRPKKLDDVIGQEHLIGPGAKLRKLIENDTVPNIILYGPPGTGKTTLAHVIANTTNANFIFVNGTNDGKKDLEKAVKQAQALYEENQSKTILFIDEIHRFNKAQQDYLLSFTENGTITLIGATTENPYFEVNGALNSRCKIFELKPVPEELIAKRLRMAFEDKEKGLGCMNLTVSDDILKIIARLANGDVRVALANLEMIAITADGANITEDDVKAIIQVPAMLYDKDGDKHYDTISAFIKSMRGSDPNGTLYYLAKMIRSGEDPKYIARRIMIHASEDVGLAYPLAICVASAASNVVNQVGLPECAITLAHAALTVAMAPKSNSSAAGIEAALKFVDEHPMNEQPDYLKDAHYKSAKKLGHGVGYKYPHDYPRHWTYQQYLPDEFKDAQLYFPSTEGEEAELCERLISIIQEQMNNNGQA